MKLTYLLSFIFFFHLLSTTHTSAKDSETNITMGAIGDSITTGFNALKWGNTKKQYSWSTGYNPLLKSHRYFFEQIFDHSISYFNVAVAGATSENLIDQVKRLENTPLDYSTFLIGANDICNVKKDDFFDINAFETNVRTAIASLIQSHKNINIVLVSIPDLYRLWEVSYDKRSCQWKWNFFRICPRLLNSKSTETDRKNVQNNVVMSNQILEAIAQEYPENITFYPELGNYQFEWEHVSKLDCFHPSISGQNLIAEITWNRLLLLANNP